MKARSALKFPAFVLNFTSNNDCASNEALNCLLAELLAAGLIEFWLAWTTNCGHPIFVVSAEEKGKGAKGKSTGG